MFSSTMVRETAVDGEDLADEVRRLRDEIRTLYSAIDELREQLVYMFNNREVGVEHPAHRPIKTMSLDPAARDFRVGYDLPPNMPPVAEPSINNTPREEEGKEEVACEFEEPVTSSRLVEQDVTTDRALDDVSGSEQPAGVPTEMTSSEELPLADRSETTKLPLIPDRQTNFAGLPLWEWPLPQRQADAVTVDRCDGPGEPGWRRFTICRGDLVRVRLNAQQSYVGNVIDISHPRKQVCVATEDPEVGQWHVLDLIYPAIQGDAVSLASELTSEQDESVPPSNGRDDEDSLESQPYTLDNYHAFTNRLFDDQLTVEDVGNECRRLIAGKEDFIEQLQQSHDADGLKRLATHFGCAGRSKMNKQQTAQAIYRSVLLSFALDEVSSPQHFVGRREEDAVLAILGQLTEGQLHAYVEQLNAEDE